MNQVYQVIKILLGRLNKNQVSYNEYDRNKTKMKKINTRNNIMKLKIHLFKSFTFSFKVLNIMKNIILKYYKKHRKTKNFLQ